MEQSPIIYSHDFGAFTLDITTSVVVQWVIIIVLGIVSFLLTRNLKEKPNKKQAAIEYIYETIKSLVTSTMGESYCRFVPYIGSLMIYLIFLNFMGLIGIKPPTQDLSVTIGLALTTFIAIHYTAIKRNGFGGYLKGYIHPFAFMAPINFME